MTMSNEAIVRLLGTRKHLVKISCGGYVFNAEEIKITDGEIHIVMGENPE